MSLDCLECGGYSLERPCPICSGHCRNIWKRDLEEVCFQKKKKIYAIFTYLHLFLRVYHLFCSLIEVVRRAGLENVPQNVKKWDVMSISYVIDSKRSKPPFEP